MKEIEIKVDLYKSRKTFKTYFEGQGISHDINIIQTKYKIMSKCRLPLSDTDIYCLVE